MNAVGSSKDELRCSNFVYYLSYNNLMYINGLAGQMTRHMRHQLKTSLYYISTSIYVLFLTQD